MTRWLVVGLIGFSVFSASAAQARTWTNRFGKTTQGDFVRVHNFNVVLKSSGRVIQVPFITLSDDDQQFIREELTKQGKADEVARLPGGLPIPQRPAQDKDPKPPVFGKPPEIGKPPQIKPEGKPPVTEKIPELPALPGADLSPPPGAAPPAKPVHARAGEEVVIPILPALPSAPVEAATARPPAAAPGHVLVSPASPFAPSSPLQAGRSPMRTAARSENDKNLPRVVMPGSGLPGAGLPSDGMRVYQYAWRCSKCNARTDEDATSCRSCGAHFDYAVDENGKRTYRGIDLAVNFARLGVTIFFAVVGLGIRFVIVSLRR